MSEPKYILCEQSVTPYAAGQQTLVSTGIRGRLSSDELYRLGHAKYPGTVRPHDLLVGESIAGVRFVLGQLQGVYDVYRVDATPCCVTGEA